MMRYLLDTNVVSELRKGARAHAEVRAWFGSVEDAALFLSVLVVGEIRQGIETIRRRDVAQSVALERWLAALVSAYAERILPVDARVAEAWGKMNALVTVPAVDGLLAATAEVHQLILVTRNTKDVERTGVSCLNPFAL